jgi:hypothetical protein
MEFTLKVAILKVFIRNNPSWIEHYYASDLCR